MALEKRWAICTRPRLAKRAVLLRTGCLRGPLKSPNKPCGPGALRATWLTLPCVAAARRWRQGCTACKRSCLALDRCLWQHLVPRSAAKKLRLTSRVTQGSTPSHSQGSSPHSALSSIHSSRASQTFAIACEPVDTANKVAFAVSHACARLVTLGRRKIAQGHRSGSMTDVRSF